MGKTDQVVQSLHSWGRFTRAVEGVLVDNIAATAPWMAPIIPAWMAYQGMTNHLGFPALVGLIGAMVVEFLGLSAITTTFQFWDWNDARRLKDQAAPVVLSAVTTAFYLIIIITVNVLLDRAETIHLIAKALLSCMSVIAGLIIALRSQHSRRISAVEEERRERREARAFERAQAAGGKIPETSGKLPETHGNSQPSGDWRNLPDEDKIAISGMTTAEIVKRYLVSDRTARNWRVQASKMNGR